MTNSFGFGGHNATPGLPPPLTASRTAPAS